MSAFTFTHLQGSTG